MSESKFRAGDCVRVLSSRLASLLRIDPQYAGYRAWILAPAGTNNLSDGKPRQWFRVEMEERWRGKNRVAEFPVDAIERTDGAWPTAI